MSYEQYFEGDCRLTECYRRAQELRDSRKNQELWLLGCYFSHAIVATVGNMFAKKGADKAQYPAEPFALTAKEMAARQEREERKARQAMKQRMQMMMASVNTKMSSETHKRGKQDGE